MHFLVVDPNAAFSTLLREELLELGHTVDACTSVPDAVSLAASRFPDMAVLDMALEGRGALSLGRQLRAMDSGVRLMLIPLIGEVLSLGEDAPTIQGVLPKPFFLPELPDRIAAAAAAPLSGDNGALSGGTSDSPAQTVEKRSDSLFDAELEAAMQDGSLDWLAQLDPEGPAVVQSNQNDAGLALAAEPSVDERVTESGTSSSAPAEEATKAPSTASPSADEAVDGSRAGEAAATISRRAFRLNQGRIEALMRDLVAEVGADGVILTCADGLLTAVGGLDEDEIESISTAVLSGSRASAEMARILGREQLRFEQSIAGGTYLLYALGIRDAILAVTVSGDAPLGLLRHRARATAERIADFAALA